MTVFGKNRMKKWYIGVIIISIMMPILIVGSIGYWFYSAGRYTLKPGEKQELHLKGMRGPESTITITFSGLKGNGLKLTGKDVWTELVDSDKIRYRFYDISSKDVTTTFYKKERTVTEKGSREIEFRDDGVIISPSGSLSFIMGGKEDSTIYFENVSDKTISFRIEEIYR